MKSTDESKTHHLAFGVKRATSGACLLRLLHLQGPFSRSLATPTQPQDTGPAPSLSTQSNCARHVHGKRLCSKPLPSSPPSPLPFVIKLLLRRPAKWPTFQGRSPPAFASRRCKRPTSFRVGCIPQAAYAVSSLPDPARPPHLTASLPLPTLPLLQACRHSGRGRLHAGGRLTTRPMEICRLLPGHPMAGVHSRL